MRKLLREHYKDLLKEEIDYSSKVATVYHLTGTKSASYDPVYDKLKKMTPEDLQAQIDAKYAKKNKSRAQSILSKVEYKAGLKDLKRVKTPKGQAYHIARSIQNNLFDLGGYFQSGGGAAYGKGLYTCYKFNPEIARSYGNIILRFDVDVSNFLIFNAGIAKGIHGEENFKLQDQFFQILKRKGFDLKGYYERTTSLEISEESENALSLFLERLEQLSDTSAFQNSDYDVDIRTADLANNAIYEFSKLFKNGSILKLRDIIDGIIFYGYSDGPVCVIYHPETLRTYKLTGAGYFDESGQPVIESDIEALAGRTGKDLTSSFQTAQALDQRAQEVAEERNEKFKNVLLQFSSENTLELEFANNIPATISNILNPLKVLLEDSIPEDIMSGRIKSTPGWNKFVQDMVDSYKYIQCLVSILAEPMLKFIEIFGPGLEIISKNEFEEYCKLFKKYADLDQSDVPKLSDFQAKGLKCVAQDEEEFSNLVDQNLKRLVMNYNSMFKEQLGSHFVDFVYPCLFQGETGSINNSIGSFSLDQMNINCDSDKNIIKNYMSDIEKKVFSVEKDLKNFINVEVPKHAPNLGADAVNNTFRYSDVFTSDGDIDIIEIIERYGWYSDWCHAGTELFYTIHESMHSGVFDSLTSELTSHKIDREKFDPEFILAEMYDVPDNDVLGNVAGIVQVMFKNGRDVYRYKNILTFDYLNKRIVESKSGNVAYSASEQFYLGHPNANIVI